jgi:hypothetical protein
LSWNTNFLVAFHHSRDDAAIITAARRYDARRIATFDREFADLKGHHSRALTPFSPTQLSMRLVFERVLILFTQNQRRIA